MTRTIVLLLFVCGLVFTAPTEASICGCPSGRGKLTPLQYQNKVTRAYNYADLVFFGEKIASNKYTVDFKVIDLWKGKDTKLLTLSTGMRRIPGTGTATSSSCDIRFGGKETKYLVFANKTKYRDFQAWSCSLTRRASFAKPIVNVLNILRKIKDIG